MRNLVVERKSQLTGVAVELENGRVEVVLEGKEPKNYSASTFKRNFKVTGELPQLEEENKMEDIKINIGGQELAPMEEVQANEIAAGDYVQTKDSVYGIVADVVGEMATVNTIVEGNLVEEPYKVEELTKVEYSGNELVFDEITSLTREVAERNEDVPKEKPAKKEKPHWTPETGFVAPQPQTEEDAENGVGWAPESVIDAFNSNISGMNVQMIDRKIGEFKSKGEIYPKYFDTFNVNGFILKVVYIHIWGSTKVELFDEEGVLLYKSPTGALKPLFDFLHLTAEQQKDLKVSIREQRKSYEG